MTAVLRSTPKHTCAGRRSAGGRWSSRRRSSRGWMIVRMHGRNGTPERYAAAAEKEERRGEEAIRTECAADERAIAQRGLADQTRRSAERGCVRIGPREDRMDPHSSAGHCSHALPQAHRALGHSDVIDSNAAAATRWGPPSGSLRKRPDHRLGEKSRGQHSQGTRAFCERTNSAVRAAVM